ncbi:MAG: hypothetical protein JNL11_17420 [Bdellovibrionaceae bacterium]|nr:hypothetical protein [Pseudobdellovibrionaceae bacterium]
MSNAKFTPGPWQLDTSSENAALIAAAPEMYEALKSLEIIYSDMSRTSFDLVEIRNLISTALKKARDE